MLGMTTARTDLILAVLVVFLGLLMLLNHWWGARQNSPSAAAAGIDIKDLIVTVKSELRKIEEERIARNEAPLFDVKDFDLELNFIVRKDEKATGGFEAKVVTFSAEAQYGSETIQKIKLHLTPIPVKQESGSASPIEIPRAKTHVIGPVPPPKRKEP